TARHRLGGRRRRILPDRGGGFPSGPVPRPVLPGGRSVGGPPARAAVVPNPVDRTEGGRRRATASRDGGGGGQRPPGHAGGRARNRGRPCRAAGWVVGSRRPNNGRPNRGGLGIYEGRESKVRCSPA